MRPPIALFSPALYFSHSASILLFRATDGLIRSTTDTEGEAIDDMFFLTMKPGKEVERSRRSVIRGVCAIRRASVFRTQNKRVFKALVFENILHKLLSIKSTSTKASFNIDAFGGKTKPSC